MEAEDVKGFFYFGVVLYPLVLIPADLAVPVVWLGTLFLSVIPSLLGGIIYLWYREAVPEDS